MKPFLNMKAIRKTLREWAGPRKKGIWKYLGKIDPFDYDDTPKPKGTRGRPRSPTKRLSKKSLEKRRQWRKASNRYWIKNQEEILLKSASKKEIHRNPLYYLMFGR